MHFPFHLFQCSRLRCLHCLFTCRISSPRTFLEKLAPRLGLGVRYACPLCSSSSPEVPARTFIYLFFPSPSGLLSLRLDEVAAAQAPPPPPLCGRAL